MLNPQVVIAGAVAFFIPVIGAVAMNWDQIVEVHTVDPNTTPGKVLFFTAKRY